MHSLHTVCVVGARTHQTLSFSLLAVDNSETYDPISYNKNMMAADQNITHALTTSGALVVVPHTVKLIG